MLELAGNGSSASTTSTTPAPRCAVRRVDPGARPRRGAAEDGYQGEYVTELAGRIEGAADADPDELARRGVELMLEGVRATLERFRVHMDRFFSERSLHEAGAVERGARAARAEHVYEHEGALWLRTTDARRRQGPRAAALRRRVHLLRLRHRLPRGQARARLRPVDRHLGRRPPRLHAAHARGLGGARRRPGPARAPDHAARQPASRAGERGADVEARGRVRHPRRPDRRHRRRRRALVPALSAATTRRSTSTSSWPAAVAGEPGLLRAVRARADRLDPAQGGRRARGGGAGGRPARELRALPSRRRARWSSGCSSCPARSREAAERRAPHRITDLRAPRPRRSSRPSTATATWSARPRRAATRTCGIAICVLAQRVLAQALDLLGVEAPESM